MVLAVRRPCADRMRTTCCSAWCMRQVPLDTIIRVHQVGANLSITVVAGQEAKERDYILSAKTEVLAEGWAKLLDYECTCSTATPDT